MTVRRWREVRAEAIASGRIDPQRVDNARKEMEKLSRTHQTYAVSEQGDVLVGLRRA